jgi:flagellar biosynthesis protein FlhA
MANRIENYMSARPQEVAVAVGIIAILVVMVIPIPTFMLDLLLSFSITFSLIILLVSIFMLTPLEFSVFPSMLLVVTLIRLSLNVASTRIILLHGSEGPSAAGQVIQSFGSFVVGGNYVVGAVIFIILVLINFIVITKGSVRTSEVAARFTLDAIPGKQMSIDADLNAGIITEEDARSRRRMLEREADFYGSMDGSIRFVRGDAIAGILIALINVVGGFAIGVFQQDMDVAEAAKVYTLLTIGDGLVTQLPALVVSTAAGIIVTRATTDKNLPNELIGQMSNNPAAFSIAAAALFFFGTIPGLPHIPFFALSALVGWISYRLYQNRQTSERVEQKKIDDEKKIPIPEKVESILPLDVMELEVGYELIPLVDADRNGELLERIKSVRRQFALELGFIVPPLHIRDNLQLKASDYATGTDVRLAFDLDQHFGEAGSANGGLYRGRSGNGYHHSYQGNHQAQRAGIVGSSGSTNPARQIQGNQSQGGGRAGAQYDDPRQGPESTSESFERTDFHPGLENHSGKPGGLRGQGGGHGCVDGIRSAGAIAAYY